VIRWLMLASPVLALGVNCAAYLALRRAFGTPVGVSIAGGLGVGLAAILMIAVDSIFYADIDPVESLVCEIGTYIALSFCFWAFLNLNITSLRIRVMRHLLQHGGATAVADLLTSYSDLERLQRRLARLAIAGQIEEVDGRWRLRSSLTLMVARCIDVVRAIMGAGEVEAS
jgi:hypothetical protein